MTALKHDGGKPPLELLDYPALAETAQVLGFGRAKYSEDGWRDEGNYGLASKRPLAAALRHIYQYLNGEQNDDESGLNHLGHAMCEVMFALAADLRGKSDVDFDAVLDEGGTEGGEHECEYCDGPSKNYTTSRYYSFGPNTSRWLCRSCVTKGTNGPWAKVFSE